jgi:peptide/nickel transport system permease protein
MLLFMAKRLAWLIPIAFVVSVVCYSISYLAPGDPARNALMDSHGRPDEKAIEEFRDKMGLDKPLYQQYISWLLRAAKGDLGQSYKTNEPVSSAISRGFLVTLKLSVVCIVLSSILSLFLGVLSALKSNTLFDQIIRVLSLTGLSMPGFWMAYMLIIFFGLNMGLLPVSGYGNDGDLDHAILPVTTLSIYPTCILTRLMRASMLDVLNQEYIRGARAKGLTEMTIIFRHGIKNALIPVVTMAGMIFGGLLSGSVIVETVFSWPGIGYMVMNSIYNKDFPMIQGCVLFISLVYLLVNFLVDLSYVYLNPRIRYEGKN